MGGCSDIEDLSKEESDEDTLGSTDDYGGEGGDEDEETVGGATQQQTGEQRGVIQRAKGVGSNPELAAGACGDPSWQPGRPTKITLTALQRERLDCWQAKVALLPGWARSHASGCLLESLCHSGNPAVWEAKQAPGRPPIPNDQHDGRITRLV